MCVCRNFEGNKRQLKLRIRTLVISHDTTECQTSSVIPVLAIFGGLMAAIMTRVSKNEMSTYGKAGENDLVNLKFYSLMLKILKTTHLLMLVSFLKLLLHLQMEV